MAGPDVNSANPDRGTLWHGEDGALRRSEQQGSPPAAGLPGRTGSLALFTTSWLLRRPVPLRGGSDQRHRQPWVPGSVRVSSPDDHRRRWPQKGCSELHTSFALAEKGTGNPTGTSPLGAQTWAVRGLLLAMCAVNWHHQTDMLGRRRRPSESHTRRARPLDGHLSDRLPSSAWFAA